MIPQVAASERGLAQTSVYVKACRRCASGVVGLSRRKRQILRKVTKLTINRMILERSTIEGDSPVGENRYLSGLSSQVLRNT